MLVNDQSPQVGGMLKVTLLYINQVPHYFVDKKMVNSQQMCTYIIMWAILTTPISLSISIFNPKITNKAQRTSLSMYLMKRVISYVGYNLSFFLLYLSTIQPNMVAPFLLNSLASYFISIYFLVLFTQLLGVMNALMMEVGE